MAARRRVRPARRRAVPGRRLGGRGTAADAGTDDCRAVDRESYPEYIRAVNFVSLISKASREELEVLALHREAALTGVRRRGEEDNVAVGEIAASGERLDDAALAGKRRVRGRVREGKGDGVADFEGDGAFLSCAGGIVGRGGRRLASRCGGRRAPVILLGQRGQRQVRILEPREEPKV